MSIYFTSDWQLAAACGQRDPRLFEIPNNTAIETCRTCLVRQECIEHALASPWQPYGIWGGKSQREVVRLWRERHPRASRAEVEQLMGVVS
jgi:hypothetical protein